MHVIKIGGRPLDDPAARAALARALAALPATPVVVHGGGAAISDLQRRLGLAEARRDGQRVTDDAGREAVEMVLSGLVNGRLVAALVAAGVDALGLAGVDRGLLRCARRTDAGGDLGWVGRVTAVRADVLAELLADGVMPVVSPVSLGPEPGGEPYNVNADDAATAIAAALGAARLDFVSDVPGVIRDGAVIASLTDDEAAGLEREGVIAGGMVIKVRAARAALAAGVPVVRIVDPAGLADPRAGTTLRGGAVRARSSGPGIAVGTTPEARARDAAAPDAPIDGAAIMADDAAYVLQNYARAPLVVVRGEGAWLWDADGRRCLDFNAGIAVNALGHGDPAWAAAVADQARRLTHVSNLYHTAPQARLARRLVEASFADRVFFCNSGTEAIEAAIKLARKWARVAAGAAPGAGAPADWAPAVGGPAPRTGLVACERAFHGRTAGAVSLTHKAAYREPFGPLVEGVRFVPFADLEALAAAVDETTCAVFVEPIQGEGGYHVASDDYLRGARALCDARGALLVFDEIQCGLGRTGKLWAHAWSGVTPDMMAVAKPLAGGLPIGALLMTQAVADAVRPGDHGSTFAGGPLVCRAAELTFDRIADPAFLAAVAARGARLVDGLRTLGSPRILEIRGRGLMVGVALDGPAAAVVAAARERGVLLIAAGESTLRLCPPLVVSDEEVDLAVAAIGDALAATADTATGGG